MGRVELSRLSGSQIRVRYGKNQVLGSLHTNHPRKAYVTFVADEIRHLYVLTDDEVESLSCDGATFFDFNRGDFGAEPQTMYRRAGLLIAAS